MRRLTFILFINLSLISYSQDSISDMNNAYFETMQNKLNLKIELDNDIESFEFNSNNSNYSIKPNTKLRLAIALNHKFLNLKIGFSPKFLANDESSKKGSTEVFKFGMDIFIKKWIQTFEMSNVKGYYIQDITGLDDFGDDQPSDYIILPNLKTTVFRGITRYNLNDNFSFKAVLNQNEIQRKSVGSFVPSYTYEYFRFVDKSIGRELQSVNLILNTGLFYTFVINKKWYSNLSISPGIGYSFNKFVDQDIQDNKAVWSNEIIFNTNTHIGLGYNSKLFFGGISVAGIATTRDEYSSIKFDSVRGIFKISLGYRFDAPKFVNKGFDWVEDKNPFKSKD